MNKLIERIPYFKRKKEKAEKELQIEEQRQKEHIEWLKQKDRISEFDDWREKNGSSYVLHDFNKWTKTLGSNDIIDLLMKYGKYINYSEFEEMKNNPPPPSIKGIKLKGAGRIVWIGAWGELYFMEDVDRYLSLYPANYIPNHIMWYLEDRLIKEKCHGK